MFQRDTRSFWSNWQLLRRRMPLPVRAHGSSTYLAWSELSQHFGMSGQRRAGEVSTIIDHPSVFWFLVYFTCDLGNFGETTLVNPKLFSSSYFKFSILASLFLVQYHHQVSLKEEFLIQFNLLCLGISSYLLYIFVANLVVYTAFYITMKIIHGEKILVPTMVYAVLALGFWIPGWRPKFGTLSSCSSIAGLYFFQNPPNSFEGTAAQSRNYNKECNMFHFYDYHDIWHFLSAAGMFFCFMLLLTLDEGLMDQDTQSILIF